MPNPQKIQIALQGGGAKLTALLAAMQAVQKLQLTGDLKVTRIAGTSAGALVAALFAADVQLGEVRESLKGGDSLYWKRIFPESRILGISKLMIRRSVWSEGFFRDQLEYFLKRNNVRTFEDAKAKTETQLFVLATNLREAKTEVYAEGDIVNKVLDSCGLPYLFRVWGKGESPVIVDGGICENLPSDVLRSGEEEFGQTVGIGFRNDSRGNPTTALSFTFSLLNAAMNNSVTRAREALGTSNVFQIETDIDTFDFNYAFSDESDVEYDRIRGEAEIFFQGFTASTEEDERIKTVTADEWTSPYAAMLGMGKIYKAHHMDRRIKNVETHLEVTAGCLHDPPQLDYVRHVLIFRTLDSPISCLGFSVYANDIHFSLRETKFEVYERATKRRIETVHLPSLIPEDDSEEKLRRSLIVFFLPKLEANSGEYVVVLKDSIKNFMGPLRNGSDLLSITPYLIDDPVDKMCIVLHTPQAFGEVSMAQSNGVGNPMGPGELADYTDIQDFNSCGWTKTNVGAADLTEDKKFQVNVLRKS